MYVGDRRRACQTGLITCTYWHEAGQGQAVLASDWKHIEISEMDQVGDYWPGSSITPKQISAGPLNLVLEGIADPDYGVLHMSLSPKVIDQCVTESDRFGLMLSDRPSTWCGLPVAGDTLVISQPGRECCSVLEPNFRSLEFFFSRAALTDEPLGMMLSEATLREEDSLIRLTSAKAKVVRVTAQVVIETAPRVREESSPIHEAARARLLQALAGTLATRAGLAERCGRSHGRSARPLIFAALREIDRRGHTDITVADLQCALSVSRRALEKSFNRMLGISPGQYLLALRLNDLRRYLISGQRGVCESALGVGLHDPSRAARQYRRLFGELPSATVRRARENVRNQSRSRRFS